MIDVAIYWYFYMNVYDLQTSEYSKNITFGLMDLFKKKFLKQN